ncbi:D-aminoacyl-tRNA deacylase [Pontiella sulfatireligans]|uniref:D-aminoacyl-tRNA deacylase n=1 Tax=Pontiella sulfatireligans TaxID=2750658 RepID=A0A6C2URJ8_9BACT|nr:D-aminoacyl-tRNA deacylase [Pontiella sulfatireligans]VGO22759.1 D-aminoacyl-tRNA deacylase [Pontiella sulfatireligans]
MKLVVQRVKQASVTVDGERISEIGAGLLVLAGVSHDDTLFDARFLAKKTANLRIFEDAAGKMNRSVADVGGQVLSVSQFTLYGDCSKGNRPSFINAARPEQGEELFNEYVQALAALGFPPSTGRFGADMKVELLNDGPVTLILESTGRTKE